MMIVMLQKLFLCLNNSYIIYVNYLDGLFGENMQGMRFKDLDFKAQRWRFYEQFWFFVSEGILSASFSFSFFWPLSLTNAPSIYR